MWLPFALAFALAFAHAFAVSALASTFAVLTFAFASFAFARGAKTRVFVLTIVCSGGMCYVHVHAVLISARARRLYVLFSSAPRSLRTLAKFLKGLLVLAFSLRLGEGWREDLEVKSTGAQISHDSDTGSGAVCRLEACDMRSEQCFEVVQIICAGVYEISREIGINGSNGQFFRVGHLFGYECTDP